MAGSPDGKRAASAEPLRSEPSKRAREDPQALLPDLPASPTEAVRALELVARRVRERPFTGPYATSADWAFKRRLYALLGGIVAAAEGNTDVTHVAAHVVDQLVHSGYAQSIWDRRELVALGAWKPAMDIVCSATGNSKSVVAAVRLYVHLAEHVNFYDDFAGSHPDFWGPQHFLRLLRYMPEVVTDIPDTIEADQWEVLCPDLEAVLRTLGSFMVFWANAKEPEEDLDLTSAMPLLEGVVETFDKFDGRFGRDISTKVRGDFVEELVRLSGVLAQNILSVFESPGRLSRPKAEEATRQAVLLLNFLLRLLTLQVPTCGPKLDGSAPGNNLMPIDERQLDTDWIEALWENCQGTSGEVVKPGALPALFRAMASMPLQEQKYRLECVAPLVFPFICQHSEQLKQKEIPPELSDLKVVMNAVLQDDASVNSEFLEEISFYPCLLEFATKRATVHAVCERVKLQMSSGDPIRLVVPRDNVLDGVCSSLNLQDQGARIDVPLEIEFRAGYADESGKELVDEGEDQGGLRRQWLDRSSRHFISSDLFRSPSQDAANGDAGLSSTREARGLIFVPSPESICRCAQDDWEEQFELFGCILGFALLYKETVPVHLGHNFLRSVFGLKTDAQDLLPLLESVDKTLHTKVKYILDGSYASLGDSLQDALEQCNLPRVFAVNESQCPELVESTLLKENGDQTPVTEENKEEFIMVLLDRMLISGLAHQVECFRRGLLRVIPEEVIQRIAQLMTLKEIELLVCGVDEIDVDDWEKYTQYENGYTRESQPVVWFWEAVRAMPEQSRATLLSFATGSSQVPSGGFRFLQPDLFTIQRVAVVDRYPEAHTCANTVDLPEYSSREELERRLHFALSETGDAFGRR